MFASVEHKPRVSRTGRVESTGGTAISWSLTPSALQRHLPTLREAERRLNAGAPAAAERLCREVLQDHPLPEAQALLAMVLTRHGDKDEALGLFHAAIGARADVPQWHHELRELHRRRYRLDDALAAARTAAHLDPRAPRYRSALAQILIERGEVAAARDCLLDALAIAPDDVESHLTLGHLLLSSGDFRAGWVEYEWRFRGEALRRAIPRMTRPVWNGMPLPDRRILIGADQGFGDGFQFARYLPLVAERCAGVVVLCRPPQIPVFSRMPGVVSCVVDTAEVGEHAAYQWLASLPGVFGTTLDTVPAATPYLSVDPARRLAWRRNLPTAGARVGLCWRGNAANSFDWRRSIPLSLLAPLGQIPGLTLFSLQVPMSDPDGIAAMGMADLGPNLTDFGETAAVIANLDLVISVDSAVLHLAGALGVPGWALLYEPADWRWLRGRADSPWYPSLRLFRQPVPGDWASVAAQVIDAARGFASN